MTSSISVDLSQPKRQSPLAAMFLVLRGVRRIGIVQLVLGAGFVLAQSPSVLVLAVGSLIVGVVAIAIGLLSWWRYTFRLVGGELHVKKGILAQDNLTVPLDRVQSVSIEQKFLHRLVHLVQVSLDTAGTDHAEFVIDAVSQDVAYALQRTAADYRQATAPLSADADGMLAAGVPANVHESVHQSTAAEQVLIEHDFGRIIQVALTQMPLSGLAVLAPILAFGDDLVERLPVAMPEIEVNIGLWLAWFVPLAVAAVVVVSLILNLARTLLRDGNLTVIRTDIGLRRNAGLLSKTSVASSLHRIQSVEVAQGVLQRRVGIHDVTLHNIGEADITVPGCERQQVTMLRDLAFIDDDGVEVVDRRVSSSEVFKATRNTAAVMALLGLGLFSVLGWWSMLLVLPIVLRWAITRRSVRLRRWGMDADSLAYHREFLGWRRREVLLRKANGVMVRQSFFERKRGLATVDVQLAGGPLSGSVSIGMIPLEQANAVRDQVLYIVETDKRVFM